MFCVSDGIYTYVIVIPWLVLASGLSYVQVDKPWYNNFMPPTSV